MGGTLERANRTTCMSPGIIAKIKARHEAERTPRASGRRSWACAVLAPNSLATGVSKDSHWQQLRPAPNAPLELRGRRSWARAVLAPTGLATGVTKDSHWQQLRPAPNAAKGGSPPTSPSASARPG
eukprot:13657349-Alexandrium_andersonii.AAC.1